MISTTIRDFLNIPAKIQPKCGLRPLTYNFRKKFNQRDFRLAGTQSEYHNFSGFQTFEYVGKINLLLVPAL
jgi:hypothetical protein